LLESDGDQVKTSIFRTPGETAFQQLFSNLELTYRVNNEFQEAMFLGLFVFLWRHLLKCMSKIVIIYLKYSNTYQGIFIYCCKFASIV